MQDCRKTHKHTNLALLQTTQTSSGVFSGFHIGLRTVVLLTSASKFTFNPMVEKSEKRNTFCCYRLPATGSIKTGVTVTDDDQAFLTTLIEGGQLPGISGVSDDQLGRPRTPENISGIQTTSSRMPETLVFLTTSSRCLGCRPLPDAPGRTQDLIQG